MVEKRPIYSERLPNDGVQPESIACQGHGPLTTSAKLDRIIHSLGQRRFEGGSIAGRDEPAGDSVLDRVATARDVRGDACATAGGPLGERKR
jgi:hypothetical protein